MNEKWTDQFQNEPIPVFLGLRGIIKLAEKQRNKVAWRDGDYLRPEAVIVRKLKELEKKIEEDSISRDSQSGPGDDYTTGYVDACIEFLGPEVEK